MQSLSSKTRWAVTYLFGVLLALLFVLGIMILVIRLKGWKNLLKNAGGVLLTPNHPSLLDPLLMIALFLVSYLRHPKSLGPYVLADSENYTKHWFWSIFSDRLLPVVRPGKDCSEEELKRAREINSLTSARALEILKSGGNIIVFFERGRTWRGEEKGDKFVKSKFGHRMIEFEKGAGLIAKRSGAKIVPVWNKITWLWIIPIKIQISIGRVIEFNRKEETEVVTRKMQEAILELSDES